MGASFPVVGETVGPISCAIPNLPRYPYLASRVPEGPAPRHPAAGASRGRPILIKLAEALQRRQKAARTAAWLIWTRGGRGLDIARHAAMDHHQGEEEPQFWHLVERIAKRRLALLDDVDRAKRYRPAP
jgi:hypothetical protein